jgi:hypothetical protein
VSARAGFCTEQANGCTATYKDTRFDKIRATEAGWFFSKAEEAAYCPAHKPDWVDDWRATQELKVSHPVESSYDAQPPVLACQAGDFSVTPGDSTDETYKAVRADAVDHARRTGHVVTVVTTRVFTVFPAGG